MKLKPTPPAACLLPTAIKPSPRDHPTCVSSRLLPDHCQEPLPLCPSLEPSPLCNFRVVLCMATDLLRPAKAFNETPTVVLGHHYLSRRQLGALLPALFCPWVLLGSQMG